MFLYMPSPFLFVYKLAFVAVLLLVCYVVCKLFLLPPLLSVESILRVGSLCIGLASLVVCIIDVSCPLCFVLGISN